MGIVMADQHEVCAFRLKLVDHANERVETAGEETCSIGARWWGSEAACAAAPALRTNDVRAMRFESDIPAVAAQKTQRV